MKSKFHYAFGLMCLSILLAYSSVAWAFDECLYDAEENSTERFARSAFYDLGSIDESSSSSDEAAGIIHCVSTHHAFDIITPGFSIEALRHAQKDLSSTSFRADSLLAVTVFDALRGRSPPRWIDGSLALGKRSRYLFLSVFLV